MKRYLVIIIALVVLLTFSACKNKEKLPDASDLDIGDFNQTITIYIATMEGFEPTNNEVTDWEYYIKDKYGVSIDLAYIIVEGDTANFVAADNLMLLEEFYGKPDKSGLIFVDNRNINIFRDSGLISPINEFMQEIDLVKTVNYKILGSFTDSSDNVWAVPYTDRVNLPMRLYCDEWLNKAKMNVPVDLKDFRDFAEFVAFNDPDGNGEDDTYIQEYRGGSRMFINFADVFHAYGCYPGLFSPLSYNPKIWEVENVILNENFPEAISFIRQMKDDGLITKGYAEQRGEREPDYYAASVISSSKYPEYWDGWQAGYYLIGTNISELITPRWGGAGVMVIEGTENPEEMLNVLGAVAETKNGILDMYYGIEGYNYVMHEDYCQIIREDDNNVPRNTMKLFYGSMKGFDEMIKNNIRFITGSDLTELETNDITYEYYDSKDMVTSLMNSDVVYMTPDIISDDRIREIEKLISEDTSLLLYGIMEYGADIEEAIENYRESLNTKGILKMIDEINAGIDD